MERATRAPLPEATAASSPILDDLRHSLGAAVADAIVTGERLGVSLDPLEVVGVVERYARDLRRAVTR